MIDLLAGTPIFKIVIDKAHVVWEDSRESIYVANQYEDFGKINMCS